LNGDRNYYGTGERKASIEVGKSYEFEIKTSPNGRINVDLSTLRPWEGGETMQSAPAQSFARKFSPGGFKGDPQKDEYWKNKEARDVHNDKLREVGATRNTALQLVGLMLANGAAKLPAKEANREEVIFRLFEHYTDLLLKGETTPEGKSEVAQPDTTQPAEEDLSWK
jgi:hypothetical protein